MDNLYDYYVDYQESRDNGGIVAWQTKRWSLKNADEKWDVFMVAEAFITTEIIRTSPFISPVIRVRKYPAGMPNGRLVIYIEDVHDGRYRDGREPIEDITIDLRNKTIKQFVVTSSKRERIRQQTIMRDTIRKVAGGNMQAELFMWDPANDVRKEARIGQKVFVTNAERSTAASVISEFLYSIWQDEDQLMKTLNDVGFTVRFYEEDTDLHTDLRGSQIFHNTNEADRQQIFNQFGFQHPVAGDEDELMALINA